MTTTTSHPEENSLPRDPRRWLTEQRLYIVTFGVLILLALLTRLLRCSDGLPYLHRYGEPNLASRALNMLKTGDPNPHWFNYGTLTIYMHAIVDAVAYLWIKGRPAGSPETIQSLAEITTFLDSKWLWTLSHPTFFLFNRGMTAILGTAAVALTAVFGRRLGRSTGSAADGRWTGLIAAALVAGTATHVDLSVFIKPDMLGSLLVLASLTCSVAFVAHGRPRSLIGSLVFGALAAAAKYNFVFCLVSSLAALLIRNRGRASRDGPTGAGRPWLWWAAFLIPPLVFFTAMPYALINWDSFVTNVMKEIRHYSVLGQTSYTVEPGLPHLMVQLRFFADNFTIPALLFATVGLYRTRRSPQIWVVLAFFGAFSLLMLLMRVSFHHNFLALYPLVAILAALGIDSSLVLVKQRAGVGLHRAACVLLVGALTLHLAAPARATWSIYRSTETRSQAVDLVNELAAERAWQRVAVVHELRIHSVDLVRLRVPFEVLGLAEAKLRGAEFDAVVSASLYFAPEGANETMVKRAARYNGLTPTKTVFGAIEGGPLTMVVRAVNPGVVIVAPFASTGDEAGSITK
jgi:hypothetical protein